MEISEARLVGQVVAMADGGCGHCVGNLVEYLNEDFPQFRWSSRVDENYDLVVGVENVSSTEEEPAKSEAE